jgi:hypothetical protein
MSDDLREDLGAAVDGTPEVDTFGEPVESVEPEPALEPLSPHEHWPSTVKERFSKADRDWQQFLLEREKQYSKGVTDLTGKYAPFQKNWGRLQQILAPHRQSYQMMGMDDFGAIQYLTNMHAAIQRDPAQGLQQLARRMGVDLNQLAQAGQGQQVSPEVQALHQQVAMMRQQLQRFGSQQSNTQMQTLEASINDWSQGKDEKGQPRYPLLDDVLDDMLIIINGKKARGESVTVQALQDIYDRAVHSNPVTRAKLSESAARNATEERKRKADEARRAGFDVKGQGGAKLTPKHDSIRADLESAWGS